MKVYMLIDRSGSMGSNWVETMSAVNNFAAGLADEKATKKAKMNVFCFDDNAANVLRTPGHGGGLDFQTLRSDVKVKAWRPIGPNECEPRGMTPLNDAVGRLCGLINVDEPKLATVVIVTDGMENASREMSHAQAKESLQALRDKGYDVVFIGADFDNHNQAASYGNMRGQTMSASAGSFNAMSEGLTRKTVAYASTGMVGSFTDDERKAAGEKTA